MRAIARVSAISGCSMALGDFVCQKLSSPKPASDTNTADTTCDSEWKLDADRTLVMALTGVLVAGPVNHLFFTLSERLSPGTQVGAILRKVS